MREILKAFFALVPNIGALRFAYIICAFQPLLQWQDEAVYTAHHETIKSALAQEVSWYKFQEADRKSKPWCISSVSDVSPQTAVLIAVKADMISRTGGSIDMGTTKMEMKDRVGCEGVDDRKIFWLSFGKTHAALRQDYTTSSVSVWLTRFFYLYVFGVAIGNVMNKCYAANDAELMREQTINYLDYRKSAGKQLKANKNKLKPAKMKIKQILPLDK